MLSQCCWSIGFGIIWIANATGPFPAFFPAGQDQTQKDVAVVQFDDRWSLSIGSRQSLSRLAAIGLLAGSIGLVGGSATVIAQSGTKPASQPAAAPGKPKQPAAKLAEPATPEQAAKVLDLRTFPVMPGAKVSDQRTLGMLMYEVPSSAKAGFEFQRSELLQRGFKEQAGGYSDAMNVSGNFTKDGFYVRVSASASSGDPQKKGVSHVSLVNDGNVEMGQLPVPPGVKPFFPQAYRAAYTTDAKVAVVAAACRKLLLAAGWEPYGQVEPNPNQPDSSMQYFKRNAIKLQSSIMVTPADGGKTLIQYSTELLSADLPAPPDIADPRYTDIQKTLRYDAPTDKTDAIIAFYQQRLPKQGWKATTERPVVDDQNKSQFVIYRNERKELLSLDLAQFTGIVRVSLKHQTAAELAEEERLAKANAAREKAEEVARNEKIKVELPLPANAGDIDKLKENVLEVQVATGTCSAALEGIRKHFLKKGWTEEQGTELAEKIGRMNFKKGLAQLSFSYFDIGLGDAEIKVSGSSNVVLETVTAKEEVTSDESPTKTKSKKKGKPSASGIPGLPDLPPGVELPADVEALVKKALQDAKKKPAPAKKSE